MSVSSRITAKQNRGEIMGRSKEGKAGNHGNVKKAQRKGTDPANKALTAVMQERLRSEGRLIVQRELGAHITVRNMLWDLKDKRPDELLFIFEGIEQEYDIELKKIGANREELPVHKAQQKQAVYNRQSEKKAVIDCFRMLANTEKFTPEKRTKFLEMLEEQSGYHGFIEQARFIVRKAKGQAITVAELEAEAKARARGIRNKPLSDKRLASLKQTIRRGTSEQLVVLMEFIRDQINKAKAKEKVIDMAEARKQRKAEGKAAQDRRKAVNG